MNTLRLSLMALGTGCISGGAVALAMGIIGWLSQHLWGPTVIEGLAQRPALAWTLPVCGGCGLMLALLHRRGPSTLLPELEDTLQDLHQPATAPKRHNKRAILGAAITQLGGGSVGPEALMSRLAVLISQRLWQGRDRALGEATLAGSFGLFGAPLLGGAVIQAMVLRDGCLEPLAASPDSLHFMASTQPPAAPCNGCPTSGPAISAKTSEPWLPV